MRGRKRFGLALLAALCLFPTAALATAQFPDALILDGRTEMLFSNPLEAHPEIKRIDPYIRFERYNTACWRRYIALWEVEKDRLYLKEIRACEGDKKADLRKVFPETFWQGRVPADWVTGKLRVPQGKQLRYVHGGYASTYERDVILTIEKGRVVRRETIQNKLPADGRE